MKGDKIPIRACMFYKDVYENMYRVQIAFQKYPSGDFFKTAAMQ